MIGRSARLRLLLGLGGFAAIFSILELGPLVPYPIAHDSLFMPLFGCIILGLSGENLLAKFFGLPPLVFVGEASYCLYLMHFNLWNLIHDSHILDRLGLSRFDPWISYALLIAIALMALHLIRLQLRFHAAVRLGEAGPAVLGFLRPRIVTPDGFQDHFTPQEQAAILAHERVHLARQDARINALAALLWCLCWFNPLIHLGARWLRIDQELACDASAVAGSISRRDYAQALLKS